MVFRYKAVNAHGAYSQGQLDAADTRAAVYRLQSMGLIPVSIEEPAGRRPSRSKGILLQRVSRKDILFFTEELSTLVHAGLPLDRSLTVAAELASKPALRNVTHDVLKQINAGKSLAESLSAHPRHFSRLYVNMVREGEAGGVLDVILQRLVEFERSADELRSYMISALIYPVLLTGVGAASIGILLFSVIPKFAGFLGEMGGPTPRPTGAMLGLSEVTRSYWWVALGSVSAIIAACRD